jgi:8-oxo-dGTP pyrophosphatase MutT (NUDIX family)
VDDDRIDDRPPCTPARRDRVGARVVLVDGRDRVLLVRILDDGSVEVPGDPPEPTYWVTVGGGSEPGETLEQTARREVFEETGIVELTLGPEIYHRRIELLLRGEPIRSVEHFFAGWVDAAEPALHHLDPAEHGVLVEHRWWTLDELASPDRQTIYPRSIARVAADAIAARDRHR